MIDFDPTDLVAIDTETTGLFAWQGDVPYAISMCNKRGETWYCEWGIDPHTRKLTVDNEYFPPEYIEDPRKAVEEFLRYHEELQFIKSVMENPKITKVFHNGKFDIRMLEVGHGIGFKGRLEETYFAARCCNSDESGYSLKYLAEKYCGVNKEDVDELQNITRTLRLQAKDLGYSIGKDAAQDYWMPRHFANRSKAIATSNYWNVCETYAVLDSVRTMMLWMMYDTALDMEGVRLVYEVEIALFPITYAMESRGVKVDRNQCLIELERNKQILFNSQQKMYDIAGYIFNINSTKQLGVIFDAFGIETAEYTTKGARSFSFNSIRKSGNHPFVHELQRFRASQKVISTFLTKYIDFAIPDWLGDDGDWCLHPMLNQAGAQTGRYSCQYPNLQQVVNANGARNAVESMSARMAFGPRKGYTWFHFDYSQLELYLFAGIAQENFMLGHMLAGNDLHTECANKAWGGRGNSAALIKGGVALEVQAEHPSTENVQRIWDLYHWDPENRLDKPSQDKFVTWWLEVYGGDNWDIVKAEAALGKKVARTRAKFVMYAKIYGGGPLAIKNFLYCSDEEAKEFQLEYDLAFPRIKQFLKELVFETRKTGSVTNSFGRVIKIDTEVAYKSVNFLVQSTAADQLKSAMLKTAPFVNSLNRDWHLLLTIHDELVFECRTPEDNFGMTKVSKQNPDGTTKHKYTVDTSHPDIIALNHIKALMEDHEERFAVPVPVECDRCDARWDQKIGVDL